MVNEWTRRHVVLVIGGVATTILMPSRWIKPVVESVVVPAHAQVSRPLTTTPAGTTTPTSTTSTTTTSTTVTTSPQTTVRLTPPTTVLLTPPTTVLLTPPTTVLLTPPTTVLITTPPATTVLISDIRLKRDVVRVGRLANGLPIYLFCFLWSDIV